MALTKVDKSLLETTSGTADATTFLRGDGTWDAPASSGFSSVQVFTASGSWTRPAGITKVIVEVLGGGSSGAASADLDDASGGGGGGYAKKFVDVSSVTASVITVGAGGTAVTAAPNVGIVGGASSWVDTASGGSLTLTGSGGAAPSNGIYAGDGTGGTGTNGDINIQGGDGFPNNGGYAGKGGDSIFGFGGSLCHHSQGIGVARGYGAGGGGGANTSGGAGTGGIVIVWEYK